MNAPQQSKAWDQIVARAWTDESFKQRLLVDPATVLREHGLAVPAGVQVRVVENTDQVLHLTLPNRPGNGDLSEEELTQVAGGRAINYLGMRYPG
jgi:hypothetical protein